jgi:hypothetical protein
LGNEPLADSVNHLLVVGFDLINIGYVTLAMKYGDKATDARTALEILSSVEHVRRVKMTAYAIRIVRPPSIVIVSPVI